MQMMSPEFANCLSRGIDELKETLKNPGDILKINNHQFWIRLDEPEKYFDVKFYKIDIRYRLPLIGDIFTPNNPQYKEYLVYFKHWDLPKAAHILQAPPRDIRKVGLFYKIRIQKGDTENDKKDTILRVPITHEQRIRNAANWCFGAIFDCISLDGSAW